MLLAVFLHVLRHDSVSLSSIHLVLLAKVDVIHVQGLLWVLVLALVHHGLLHLLGLGLLGLLVVELDLDVGGPGLHVVHHGLLVLLVL